MLTAKQAHTVRALSSLHAILINKLNTMRQKQSSAYFTRLHFLGHPLRPNTATPFSWDMQTQGRHYSLLWHSCFTPNCSFSSICIVVVILSRLLRSCSWGGWGEEGGLGRKLSRHGSGTKCCGALHHPARSFIGSPNGHRDTLLWSAQLHLHVGSPHGWDP